MKRKPKDYLERQLRIARNRHNERLRKRSNSIGEKGPLPLATVLGLSPYFMPEICSFSVTSIDTCIEALWEIRGKVEAGQRLLLDFSKTTAIYVAFAVYTYADFQDLIEHYGQGCLHINIQSISRPLRYVLKQSGLLELTNRINLPIVSDGLFPIVCGLKDDQLDEIIPYLIEAAEASGNLSADPKGRAEAELLTSRAISEAMLNVYYHAYPNSDESDRQWWFTAGIIEEHLYISLCDRGVGIHQTLPRTEWWERVMGKLPLNDDASMIQAAMTYTRSSAKNKGGRGLGTKDMQNLVLERGQGFLNIISGRGHYTLDASKARQENTHKASRAIVGTSVSWKIPLKGAKS